MNPCVIDLSHWNTPTDWHAIRSVLVLGIIHKATEGSTWRDPKFEERRAPAKNAGFLFGRYHFGIGEDVPGQVDNFLKTWTPDELLALDWEQNVKLDANGRTVPAGPTMSLSEAEEFCSLVFDRTGLHPLIYGGATLKEAVGTRPTSLTKCRLWLAQYGPTPVLPHGWPAYWLWQFTDQAIIPGINARVDRSMFDGTVVDFAAQWKNAPAQVVPAETPYAQYKRLAIERGVFPVGEDHALGWTDLSAILQMVPVHTMPEGAT